MESRLPDASQVNAVRMKTMSAMLSSQRPTPPAMPIFRATRPSKKSESAPAIAMLPSTAAPL